MKLLTTDGRKLAQLEAKLLCQACLRIPGAVIESFRNEDGKLDLLRSQVDRFNQKHDVSIATATAQSNPNPETQTEDTARTLAKPQFAEGDRPLDPSQRVLPAAVMDVEDFKAQKELLARYLGSLSNIVSC